MVACYIVYKMMLVKQTAVINIMSFRIFIYLTFRMLFNIVHFQKWSLVTIKENDETIYIYIYI